jgi:hypothetical protein
MNNRDWLKERLLDLKEAKDEAEVVKALVDAFEDGHLRGYQDGWRSRDEEVANLKALLKTCRDMLSKRQQK